MVTTGPALRRAAPVTPSPPPPLDVDDQLQVGFDAPFVLTARAAGGRIEWRQVGGPAVAFEVSDDGATLRARTPALSTLRPSPQTWGVLPLSAASIGELRFTASLDGAGGRARQRSVRVTAAARSSGLPSVAVDHRLYLGGSGWRLVEAPRGAKAAVVMQGGLATLRPDVSGAWRLADGAGRELKLRSGRYDETPLDCGRTECHPREGSEAEKSPMTSVLARGLDGALDGQSLEGALDGKSLDGALDGKSRYDPSCAIACHAVGEPGLDDGGFSDVMTHLGGALPSTGAAGSWSALPRALRRLGGVGCTACHGPGAIPEHSGRWSILGADVCAVCHDAPPRYGQVAAWRDSRMARADSDPATREGDCSTCHTTSGFLASLGVRSLTDEWRAPADAQVGISCAACHEAHGPSSTTALLRLPPLPAALRGVAAPARSQVCLACHSPLKSSGLPQAAAAALWLGRGGVHPSTGQPLDGAPLHVTPGGCVTCHRAVEAGGAGHRFSVDSAACGRCHREPPVERAAAGHSLQERARGLWARLVAAGAIADATGAVSAAQKRPLHAIVRTLADGPLGLAATDVLLVLDDPAAAAHNAPYARALLDEAERALR